MTIPLVSDRKHLAQILLTDECFSIDRALKKSLLVGNHLIFQESDSICWQLIFGDHQLSSKFRLEHGIKNSKGTLSSDTRFLKGVLQSKVWYLNGKLLGHPFGQARYYDKGGKNHCVTYTPSEDRIFNLDYLIFNQEGNLVRASCILNGKHITEDLNKSNRLLSICPELKLLTFKDSFNILEAIHLSCFDLIEMQYR